MEKNKKEEEKIKGSNVMFLDDSSMKCIIEGKNEEESNKLLNIFKKSKDAGNPFEIYTTQSSLLRAIWNSNPESDIKNLIKLIDVVSVVPSFANFRNEEKVKEEILFLAERQAALDGKNEEEIIDELKSEIVRKLTRMTNASITNNGEKKAHGILCMPYDWCSKSTIDDTNHIEGICNDCGRKIIYSREDASPEYHVKNPILVCALCCYKKNPGGLSEPIKKFIEEKIDEFEK